MSTSERGALVLEVPQTFARSNWPFLVFLLFLGTVLAIPAWMMGNYGIAVALFSIGLGVAFVAFLVQRGVELKFASVLAVHERGLLVRQRGEHFVRWNELERIERWTETVENVVDERATFVRLITLDGRRIALGSREKLHEAVLTRAGLSPTDLGHKSGW